MMTASEDVMPLWVAVHTLPPSDSNCRWRRKRERPSGYGYRDAANVSVRAMVIGHDSVGHSVSMRPANSAVHSAM
jgi:hypothetical protein